jgi:RimJ/RimL family protein N-acetyltransferase
MSTSATRDLDVRLAPWTDGDLALLRRLNEPAMTEHLGGPETEEKLLQRHRRYLDASGSETTYVFKVVIGPEGTPAGSVNFWDRIWHDAAVYEMGWGILPEYQGMGLATRAVVLALDRARATKRRRFVHAFPSVDNAPSNAICRKAGFAFIEAVDFEYPPGHIMRCNDWRFDLAKL